MTYSTREPLFYVVMNEDGKFYVSRVVVEDPFRGIFGGAFCGDGGGTVHCVFSDRLRQAMMFKSRGKCERKITEVERWTGARCKVAGVTMRDVVEQMGKEFGQ